MSEPVSISLSLFQREMIKMLDGAVAYATKERDAFIRGVVSSSHEGAFNNIELKGDSIIITPATESVG